MCTTFRSWSVGGHLCSVSRLNTLQWTVDVSLRIMLHHLEFSSVLEDPQHCFPLMAAGSAQSFLFSASLLTLTDILLSFAYLGFSFFGYCFILFSVLGIEPRASQIPGNTLLPPLSIPAPSLILLQKFVIAHAGLELTLQPSLAFRLHSVVLNFGSSCLSFLISGLRGPSLASFVYSVSKSWFFNMSLWF